jgi:alpha-tubulin suppressor-like RCC1 family protein
MIRLAISLFAGLTYGSTDINGRRAATLDTPGSSEPTFVAVSAGDDFTCALTAEGKAACWGNNAGRQLGSGLALLQSDVPVPVAGTLVFTVISAGEAHACGLTSSGEAFCWGSDASGALGNTRDGSAVPIRVTTTLRFASINAGVERTCAVTRDGAAYCWGRFSVPDSTAGGRSTSRPTPVRNRVPMRLVRTGLNHACGIGHDERVYCWGSNNFGQLGVAPAGASGRHPVPVSVALEGAIATVSVSRKASCAVTTTGLTYCWGENIFGVLGNGSETERYVANPTPARVVGTQRWRLVSAGGSHTCGLTLEGKAACWGANFPLVMLLGTHGAPDRCAGNGPPPRECSTRPIPVAGDLRFRDLSAGGGHTCAVTTAGRIYCWGGNDSGQLGNGSRQSSVEPIPVVFRAAAAPVPPVR